jgi:protein arginine kinase activator
VKCEICHQAEAETVIRETIKGEVCERFVCRECARRQQASAEAAAASSLLVEILLGASFSLPGESSDRRSGGGAPCPACGMTYADYRKRSRLGCATCYDHFARELGPLLRDMHRGDRHAGKVPRHARLALARERLETALAEAIARQQYEQAAILRDQLRVHVVASDSPSGASRGNHA